jgi:hypothetical protein
MSSSSSDADGLSLGKVEEALSKHKQVLAKQKKEYEDKISSLTSELEKTKQQLARVKAERDGYKVSLGKGRQFLAAASAILKSQNFAGAGGESAEEFDEYLSQQEEDGLEDDDDDDEDGEEEDGKDNDEKPKGQSAARSAAAAAKMALDGSNSDDSSDSEDHDEAAVSRLQHLCLHLFSHFYAPFQPAPTSFRRFLCRLQAAARRTIPLLRLHPHRHPAPPLQQPQQPPPSLLVLITRRKRIAARAVVVVLVPEQRRQQLPPAARGPGRSDCVTKAQQQRPLKQQLQQYRTSFRFFLASRTLKGVLRAARATREVVRSPQPGKQPLPLTTMMKRCLTVVAVLVLMKRKR